MSAALYTQRAGRAPARSFVHAQRARKLRKAGKRVSFHHTSSSGRSVYVYVHPSPTIVDYAPSWGARPYTIEQARRDFIALREASRQAVLDDVEGSK